MKPREFVVLSWPLGVLLLAAVLLALGGGAGYAFGLRADVAPRTAAAWVRQYDDLRGAVCTEGPDGVVCVLHRRDGARIGVACPLPHAFDLTLACGAPTLTTYGTE